MLRRAGVVAGLVGIALSVLTPVASAGLTPGWVGPFADKESCEGQREITMEYHPVGWCQYRDVPGDHSDGWYFRVWTND
ncbi:hypothetical protein V5P93_003314 [Actinokineospora auranticolor]|nr:hypothetical protein [Actinokineospora auranticolor]